jgi:predicted esterase
MTPSPLLRRVEGAASGQARAAVLALHREGEDSSALVPFCRAVSRHLRVWAPQAPRARNPLLGSGHGGAGWGEHTGYVWYRVDDAGRVEPASFGDALLALEALALEVRAAEPRRLPLLAIGAGQGGTLARALSGLRPGLLQGVVTLSREAPAPHVLPRPPVPWLCLAEPDAAAVRDWMREGGARWDRARTRSGSRTTSAV